MSIDTVREYLSAFGVEDRIRELALSSATVPLAAQALGCGEERIAKTLSFHVHDQVVLVVMAGDTKIDNSKFKAQFSAKAKMLAFAEAGPLVGHGVGGVCPFAIKPGVATYLDVSLRRFATVFPACGSGNSAIELTPDELEQYAQHFSGWVDVCKLS